MSVNMACAGYMTRMRQWRLVRDCVEGAVAVKARGTEYLPKLKGQTEERYQAYVRRASFVNYTAQTLSGIHGMVFRRLPEVTAPDEMADIIADADMRGTSLAQFLSTCCADFMQTCFGGIMADIPPLPAGATVADAESMGARPYLTWYPAESVINWRTDAFGKRLSMVVLKEDYETAGADEFVTQTASRYRVLDLDNEGFYRQRIYEAGGDVIEVPVSWMGHKLRHIPFHFPLGMPDKGAPKPMLYDLAEVNIAHYMMTADYRNGVHMTCLPTGYMIGHTPNEDKDGNAESVMLGTDNFITLREENAKIGTLCYAGEGLAHMEKAIEGAEMQMIVLGSRIITPEKGVSETAESANIHRAGENAKLAAFANSLSDAATGALQDIAEFMGCTIKPIVRLNTDYETQGFDANTLNSMANIFTSGKMPLYVLYSMMMRGEFLNPDMTFDDYTTLLDLEASGKTAKEVYDEYNRMKQERGK